MTKSSPTIPSFAARVWLIDNQFHVDLPDGGGHRLTFPSDMQGLLRLRQLLANRHSASRIGEPGDLTQAQVNKQLKTKINTDGIPIKKVGKPKFSPEVAQAAKGLLRRLGL